MLLNFGKIRRLTEDDKIFDLRIGDLKDYYEGTYYIDKAITLNIGEVPSLIGPGMLEVFVTYDKTLTEEEYLENITTKLHRDKIPYYINFKMINKNGSLFTWRYFVDINNEELYIDRNNYPIQILTKNQIGNLIYTKQEMESLFINRYEEHLDEPDSKWYIKVPKMQVRELDLHLHNMGVNIENPRLFKENSSWRIEDVFKFGIINLGIETIDRKVFVDSQIKTHYREWSLGYEYPNTSDSSRYEFNPWVDIFRKGNTSWYTDKYNPKHHIHGAQSHRITFNTDVWMHCLHYTLGEYFTNFNPNRHLQGSKDNLTDLYNLEGRPYDTLNAYKIEHNTYLPGLYFTTPEIIEDIFYTTRTTRARDAKLNYGHLRSHDTLTNYVSKIYTTPDEDLVYYPLVQYGDGNMKKIIDTYLMHNRPFNESGVLKNILPIPLKDFDSKNIYVNHNLYYPEGIFQVINFPRYRNILNRDLGLLMTVTRKKQSLENIFRQYTEGTESVIAPGITYGRPYGEFKSDLSLMNNDSVSIEERTKSDFRALLIEGDPFKSIFRAPAINKIPLNHLNELENVINNKDVITGIKLGPETTYSYDLTNVPFNDKANKLKRVHLPYNYALTYFKMEINKDAPKYNIENKDRVFSTFVLNDADASVKYDDLMSRGMHWECALSIDKLTMKFAPILVRIRGEWRDIQRQEIY